VAVAAVGAFWLAFANTQMAAIDSSLSSQAQSLAAGVQDQNGNISFNGQDVLPGQTSAGIAVGALLVGPGQRVLARSGDTPPLAAVAPLLAQSQASRSRVAETRLIDGLPERVLVQPVALDTGVAWLVVSRPVLELEDTLTRTALLLTLVLGVLVLAASVLGYWLAGRALQPVRVIAGMARQLGEHDLHRRITLDLPPDELGELAATFNQLLSRLEAAFASLQRFTADAAHELRAPLARMRAEMEVTLARERSGEQYRASLQAAVTEVAHLARMAEQLLLLARADAGALPTQMEDLDARSFLGELVTRWQPLARERGIVLSAELPAAGTLHADPNLLRRLLDNLLDNALRAAGQGGAVRVAAGRQDGAWRLSVTDSGPGVEASLRSTLFERFTRGDPARGRATGGAGLGLSLCAVIAQLHHGSIALEDNSAGATFVVQLPVSENVRDEGLRR
jgi:heavy metal sensor kinase